jgi:hypothetical protein
VPPSETVGLEADSTTQVLLGIPVPDRTGVQQRNIARVIADAVGHPAGPAVPIAPPGAHARRIYQGQIDETVPRSLTARTEVGHDWTEISVDANLPALVRHPR